VKNMTITPFEGPAPGFLVRGELDMLSAPLLERVIADAGPGTLVLDLSGVTFIDSTGLRLLIRVCVLSEAPPQIVLRNPSRPVRRVLELCVPNGAPGLRIHFEGQ
jgi:anti-anti-sigma factor